MTPFNNILLTIPPSILQALRLFRLAAELEHKASALKAEALQHLFVALAGSDCRELWTLLVHFFGKGTGFDPFDFLDSAPAIKAPLDLGDTDSDDDAASSTTLGSVSTTASTAAVDVSPADAAQASTSGAPTTSTRPKLKPKVTLPDLVPTVDEAEGFIPTSYADLHSTGIPRGVHMRRSEKTTARGSSLYICPHQDCGSTPYVRDLYGCSSHLSHVHYGTSLMCPYCPNQKYYRVSGWKNTWPTNIRQFPGTARLRKPRPPCYYNPSRRRFPPLLPRRLSSNSLPRRRSPLCP